MTTLFISDLHLEAARPDIGNQFLEFLSGEATAAEALYILGDLFESWVGDDDPDAHYAVVKLALRSLADVGVPVYFMHGNRDFMIGERFAEEAGLRLLPDPYLLELYGGTVLLSHGDALCTDDVEYQKFRLMTRDPGWQATFVATSLAERQAYAAQVRAASFQHGKTVSQEITDVNQAAVGDLMRRHEVSTLLHGHTHRPAVHEIDIDGRPATRIVLGDWYEQGSIVRWDAHGPVLSAIPR